MKNYIVFAGIILSFVSCKLQPDSNRGFNKDKIYKLQLNPSPGSVYKYDIINETEMDIEVQGQEVSTLNRSSINLEYAVSTDSAGNYVFTTTYNKIRLYAKNGDKETDLNTENVGAAIAPVERMLDILKSAKITATVNRQGEVINVNGYDELGDQLMAGFATDDQMGKEMARQQWNKTIGNGIVKASMEQLFKVFPDSAIHIGDTWRTAAKLEGELPMNTKSTYTLKAINDQIAIISAEGIVTSDDAAGNSGARLNGKQTAQFEVETKTGLLINGRIKSDVEGFIQVRGQEIPVSIKMSVKIDNNK